MEFALCLPQLLTGQGERKAVHSHISAQQSEEEREKEQ